MANPDISVFLADKNPEFVALSKIDLDAILENLPLAYGTATHGFGLELDGTSRTMQNLELILGKISEEVVENNVDSKDERLKSIVAVFSSYLGEVFKSEHRGEWMVCLDPHTGDERFCVRSSAPSFSTIFPFDRVVARIVRGSTFNVADYYLVASKLVNAA